MAEGNGFFFRLQFSFRNNVVYRTYQALIPALSFFIPASYCQILTWKVTRDQNSKRITFGITSLVNLSYPILSS